MDNVHPEGTEDQYVISPNGEVLGTYVHVRRSKRIRISPQRYNPGLGLLENEILTLLQV